MGEIITGSAAPRFARRIGVADEPQRPQEPSLRAIERRRRRLWLLMGFFLLAASATVALALTDAAVAEAVPDVPALRWGLLVLAAAFLLYVFDQERLLRRFTRAFVAHDVQTATLESRISDLTTLTRVGRTVNSVLTIDEVAETVLDAASELARARNGSVMLRGDDLLWVVASRGPEAAPTGARASMGEGLVGEAATKRQPLLVTGRLRPDERAGDRVDDRPFGSAVVVPLEASDEVVGVLSLERAHDDEELTELDLRSIALFAEHAGVAIANAQRYEDERSTAARLTEALELRSEFVAALVHDLKSPITAVLGFTSLMQRPRSPLAPEERTRALTAITEESGRLLQMVDELLYSTSVDAGAQLRRAPVELGALLDTVVGAMAAGARAREGVGRTVDLVIEPGCEPATVQADAQALRHVFTNLLDNAVKYSPPGSPVGVRLAGDDRHVTVSVTDAGDGIDEADLPHVFDRFRQASGRARAGVGLGLYIARTLVTAHGGRISVSSRAGEGATFRVELPVRGAEEHASPVEGPGATAQEV